MKDEDSKPSPRDEPPAWTRASLRVLRRAHRFMESDDEDDREDALIHSDRAVEIMVASYVSLPERVRKLQIPREQSDHARSPSFPQKLDFLDWYLRATGKADERLLMDAAHYHTLRNPAYHATTGFIPAPDDVRGAFHTAVEVFRVLFGFDPLAELTANTGNETRVAAAESAAEYVVSGHDSAPAPAGAEKEQAARQVADKRPYSRRPGNLDELLARADDWGVGPEVRMLLDVAEALGLVRRVFYHCVMLTSPRNRATGLLIVAPDWREGGRITIWVAPARFAEFYPHRSEDEYRRRLGFSGRRYVPPAEAGDFASRLEEALRD